MSRASEAGGSLEPVNGRARARTLYDALQVSSSADEVVVQAAYRALTRAYHPDVNPTAEAQERSREIHEAYGVLGDARRRALYDLSVSEAQPDQAAGARQHGVRRPTACWRCELPLEGAFGRYCGRCRWIICEHCRACGCQHPDWQLTLAAQRAGLSGRGLWIALSGWIVAATVAAISIGRGLIG